MMKFNFFSAREASVAVRTRPVFDSRGIETERAALTIALHSLLETLPQSYSGRENIQLLCHAILGATSHLRFVWVGFSEDSADAVTPYATAGDCAQECQGWQLPAACFDPAGPYSQAFPGYGESADKPGYLFMPWRDNRAACTVASALAIPLRSEKRGLRGMIVFYADSLDYFSHMGAPLFQAFCHVAEIIWKQSNLLHRLTQKAQQDPLTGLMNRRHAMNLLEKAIAHAHQAQEPLSILLCRVEGFDKINDLYGWMAADSILAAFAKETVAQMRPQDKGGRWTGIEFLYILPDADAERAAAIASNLQQHFLMHPVNVKNWSIRLALAVGVAAYSTQCTGPDDLIQQANQHMLSGADELPFSTL